MKKWQALIKSKEYKPWFGVLLPLLGLAWDAGLLLERLHPVEAVDPGDGEVRLPPPAPRHRPILVSRQPRRLGRRDENILRAFLLAANTVFHKMFLMFFVDGELSCHSFYH